MKILLVFLALFACFSVKILSQDIDPNSFDFDFDFGFDDTIPEFEYTTLNPELLFPENEEEPKTTESAVEVFSEWPVSGPSNTGDEIEESEESSKEGTTLRPMNDIPTTKSTTEISTTPKLTTPRTTTLKSTTPKSTTPKTTTPKTTTPKATTPRATTPKTTTPKTTTPKTTTPRTTTPKATTPKITTPKATSPTKATPKSTTIRPTTPKTTMTATTEQTTTEENTTEFIPAIRKKFQTDEEEQSENDDDTDLQFIGEKIPIPDENEAPVRPVLRIPNIMDILKGISNCCTDESSEESPWTVREQPIEPQVIHVKSIPIVPVAKKCYYQVKAGPSYMNGDSIYGRLLNGISVQRCYYCCETSTYRQCSFTYARDCMSSVVNIQEETPYYQQGRGIIRISNWG